MRNVISLNKNWAFIQENAGLPGEMPTDWHKVDLPHTWNAVDGHDGTVVMTEVLTGMRKHLKHQNSPWEAERSM